MVHLVRIEMIGMPGTSVRTVKAYTAYRVAMVCNKGEAGEGA